MFNLSWSVGTIPHYRLIQKLESFIGDEYIISLIPSRG